MVVVIAIAKHFSRRLGGGGGGGDVVYMCLMKHKVVPQNL